MTEALRVADQYKVAAITNRRINHADYWSVLQPSLVSSRLKVEEIGKSMMGRQLRSHHVRQWPDEGVALVADAWR